MNVSEGLIIIKGVLCDIGKCTDVNIVVPHGVLSIGPKAFSGCKRIKNMAIPATVSDIGAEAFKNCVNLESLTIYKPEDMLEKTAKDITPEESGAPSKETKTVNIPLGTKAIGQYTFYGCKKIKVVVIPESVKYIDNFAFTGCKSLKVAAVPKNTSVYGRAFDSSVKIMYV
ncbi:MAG: leucine-rich repeat domain-containing protein [Clostridiales bacterium]|nr:leucine-rich repeat domain-containing protein [Clostridiales bacterium]